jgi:hypothetical protein
VYPRNRLGAVGAALISVGVLAGATAAPAGAATQPSTQAPAAGSILCDGDLCLQTVSVNTTNHTAQVNAWANTTTLNPGFFTLLSPLNSSGVGEALSSPVRKWPAGGTHFTFTVWLLHGTYYMSAHAGKPPGVSVGFKGFGINF